MLAVYYLCISVELPCEARLAYKRRRREVSTTAVRSRRTRHPLAPLRGKPRQGAQPRNRASTSLLDTI